MGIVAKAFSTGSVLSLACVLSACSLISARTSKSKGPEIQDVPFQARESREASPRRRVMILPFVDSSGKSAKASEIARDAFVKAVRKTDDFVVISNNDFPKDTATFLKNGEYDLEVMGRLAGAMGLAAIIEGKVVDIKARRIGDQIGLVRELKARVNATIQLRMVNTKNGSIILNETKSSEIEDTVTRYAESAVNDRFLEQDPKLIELAVTQAFRSTLPRITQVLDKLSWEGRVALVKGDRIYLNAGRLSGIMIGDILKVTDDGEDVFDPESGALIGKVPGRLKGTIEVVSYFGKDGSISVVHSGSGFHENDRVELY